MASPKRSTDYAYNRRVNFDYAIMEKFEAGISLLGVEVKSVRAGHMSLRGAFVTIHDNHAILTNATIPPWQVANTPDSYEPTRSRQLLLKKSQLKQIIGARQAQGLTVVPIRVYNKRGKIKVEIALARGKRKVDKKQDKQAADVQRDVDRVLRGKDY